MCYKLFPVFQDQDAKTVSYSLSLTPRESADRGDTRLALVFLIIFFLSSSWSWNSNIYYTYVRLALQTSEYRLRFLTEPMSNPMILIFPTNSRKKGLFSQLQGVDVALQEHYLILSS